nr:hypothetical protein [uncultured Roseateles sp.]
MNESTVGRTPITIVEIDQDKCTRTYGVAPCTAAVGVTGAAKCYNTRATCQDPDNYDRGTLTLSFTRPHAQVPRDRNIIPSLTSTSTAPSKINPNGNSRSSGPLGQRATASVGFQDHPHSDLLTDPYRSERGYDPLARGTFWSKWLARNPYYQNRPLRIREGYLGQAVEEMQTRHYLIDSIDGPDSNGRVTVRGKDPLKLADAERAQAPLASPGELRFDIGPSDTSFQVARALASDYPSPGTVRIGDECMQYASAVDTAGYVTFSGVTRGTDGTVADDHATNDQVQWCLRYTDAQVWEVAEELLTQYAAVDPAYIPSAEWAAEGGVWLPQFNVTTLITEPTGVGELLGELTEQALFYLWWDERTQDIKLRAVRPAIGTVPTLTDDSNILADSVSLQVEPAQRVSQVWVYFDPKDRTQGVSEEKNYRRLRVRADLEAESANKYGEQRIRKIYARWIQNEAQALNLSVRIMAASIDNPRFLRLRLDAKDRSLWTADIADVLHRNIVDADGLPVAERYQAISVNEVQPGEVVEYDMMRSQFTAGRFGFYMAADAPVFTAATEEQLEAPGAWYADVDGKMSDGSDGWKYQ